MPPYHYLEITHQQADIWCNWSPLTVLFNERGISTWMLSWSGERCGKWLHVFFSDDLLSVFWSQALYINRFKFKFKRLKTLHTNFPGFFLCVSPSFQNAAVANLPQLHSSVPGRQGALPQNSSLTTEGCSLEHTAFSQTPWMFPNDQLPNTVTKCVFHALMHLRWEVKSVSCYFIMVRTRNPWFLGNIIH